MVINFTNDLIRQHVNIIVGWFEVWNTLGVNMAKWVKSLLGSFGLLDKVMAYFKDEGNNFASLIIALTSIASCSTLKLVSPFLGLCFGHAMFKATQYATNDSKVCVGMIKVNLKKAQATL